MSLHVLVVDDDEHLRQALEELLEMEGYSVAGAPLGPAALSLADQESFDLMLVGFKLPGTGSLSVLPALRSRLPGVPIILMSAQVGRNTVADAYRAGACDFIVKPFNTEQVLAAIRRALEQPAVGPAA